MRSLANHLNTLANTADKNGHTDRAILLYKLATLTSPSWSVPHYNLGLVEKNRGNWHDSLAHNQRAAALDPTDQDSWWNLAIAATAVHNWPEALRAWHAFGIDSAELRNGQIYMPPATACVRLDPEGEHPEVVWGTRLDAARIQVLNIPLPRSGRRYRDIILNDGAPAGERTSEGQAYPVFDELAVWQASPYSTFTVTLRIPDEAAEEALSELCEGHDIALEDRRNVRILCAACSRGNPGEHICSEDNEGAGDRNFAFAARSRECLADVLQRWTARATDRQYSTPERALNASE